MVGKWYKFIGDVEDNTFIKNNWYKCISDIEDFNAFLDEHGEGNGFYATNKDNFDLSNPIDHNPDEVKEEVNEVQPKFKVDTITIIILQDGSYQTTSTLEYPKMIKHIKEVAYLGDKQINENT
jgi:hypothetical protein